MIQITFDNKTMNLSEWARHLKISYSKLYRLTITWGIPFEESLELILSKSKIRNIIKKYKVYEAGRMVTYNGVRQSIHKWAEELNLSYFKIKYRMDKLNLSFEDAVKCYDVKRKIYITRKSIEYNGKKQNLTQWCKELNLNYAMISNRIHQQHMSFEDAVKLPKREYKLYSYNGKTQTLSKWAKELGTHCSTLTRRINIGWPIANVLTKTPRPRDKRKIDMSNGQRFGALTITSFNHRDEKYYDFYKVQCDCGNIKTSVYGQNLRAGLSKSCGKCDHEYITFDNQSKPIKQWSNELKIPRSTIRDRLERNLPIEQVLNSNYKRNLTLPVAISKEYEQQPPNKNSYIGF